MHSELHERLEYLVNYSSQLIFVSSDSIAQQKRTLEAFVFQQSDDTEIAFITADEAMETGDYRRQLCRQLLGQMVGSYIRPLNELLASLNQHDGPILITITQAQFIPDKLLQELWDLVLQSRFAANKQHLNVLLFGESQWAERAKQWLPAKNSDTPLLISNQSVAVETTDSNLDRMITKRREAFHAHLAKRYGSAEPAVANRIKSPWVWAGAGLLFVVLFTAMLGWQYRDSVSSLFKPLAAPPLVDESPDVAPGSAYQEIAQAEPEENTQTQQSAAAEAELVTDWQGAIENLKSTPPGKAPVVQEPSPASGEVDKVASSLLKSEALVTSTDEEPELSTQDNQVAKNLSKPLPASTVTEVNNDPGAASPPLAEESVFANKKLQETIRSDDFLIQLAGLKDAELLSRFIKDYNLEQLVYVYQTRRYGGDWYVLLFHQPFASLQAARQAVAQLPEFPGKSDAFVKRGSQILAELEAAQ